MTSFYRRAMCGAAFAALASTALVAPAHAQNVETVIVTASKIKEDPPIVAEARKRLSRTPGAVAVVAAETYENRLVIGMPDLLRDVPGVISEKRYGEESRLSIRGSGISQAYHQRGVLLAQDGVPFADADGFSDFQKVDALGARYIEVYKGGNALRFGGAQLGGAINLISPTGRTADSEYSFRIEGGSFGTFRTRGALAESGENVDVYASAEGLTADGYRERSGQRQSRGTLNIGYDFGDEQEIRLIAYGADIMQEVPGTLNLLDAINNPHRAGAGVVANKWARNQQVGRLSLQTHWKLADGLNFEGGVYVTHTDLHHPISIVIDQDVQNQGAFGRFDWTGEALGRPADLFFGVSYRDGTNDQDLYANIGGMDGFHFGDSQQKASGLDIFAEGRWFVIDNLALVAGASLGKATREYHDHLNPANDDSRDFNWLAPRFGVLWEDESGTQVYANFTRSVEPPHYGALVQSPFPGFVPVASQDAWTGEIGTRGHTGALTWDFTLYRSQVRHELLSYAVFGLPAAFFNADRTIHQGLEAALDWRIAEDADWGSLLLRQSYSWSDFTFDNDATYGNNRLPVVPEHQYRAELRYGNPNGFFIAPSLEWRPVATNVDYANTLKAPSFVVFSLGAGYTVNDHISLFMDARNLADKHYVPEFGAVTDASNPLVNTAVFYPGEGRSLFVGLTAKY
ncbi:MAG: TonB-dependent receptor [Alphaproteobacteria bacterium]|nr:TonB-dependent receptor [Alphaproteobacteria bacterium]